MKILKQHIMAFILLIVIAIAYIIFSLHATNGNLKRTDTAYYNYQILMLKRGRLDLNSPITYDLSLYKNKWYMYWGPAPVLFVFPFYILGKINTSDVIYTLAAGIFNVGLFYLIILEYCKFFKLKISRKTLILLILGFAFVTPNFLLSLKGTVWATSQMAAMFYMFISLLLLGKYLNSKKLIIFFLSFIFFCLAAFSRYTMIIQGFIFLFLLILLLKKRKIKELIKTVLIMIGVSVIFLSILFAYNYLRFNNPFELGLQYQKGAAQFDSVVKQNKLFSFSYIPHNLDIYFMHHLLPTLKKPYLIPDKEGNSVISVYPIFLLLFGLFLKQVRNNKNLIIFSIIGLIPVCMGVFILLMCFGTGWVQFGLRYLSDVTPITMLLLIPAFIYLPTWITSTAVIYGSMIELFGIYSFFTIYR